MNSVLTVCPATVTVTGPVGEGTPAGTAGPVEPSHLSIGSMPLVIRTEPSAVSAKLKG